MKNELSRRNNYSDYDFFDEAMHDFFPAFYGGRHAQKYMRTDIKENENDYLMEVEMPGLDKKDIHVDLKDGYLNISASKSEKHEEGKEGKLYSPRTQLFVQPQLLCGRHSEGRHQSQVRKRHFERRDPERSAEEGGRAPH